MDNTKVFYAGIGSRTAPNDICNKFTKLAIGLAFEGEVLRTGGADGADTAFYYGAIKGKGEIELYLPWAGFNGHWASPHDRGNGVRIFNSPTPKAFKLAKSIHPYWDRLSNAGKTLHARNCHQVLGYDLETPVYSVVCWTVGGGGAGGTGQAMRLAHKFNIPVLDYGKPGEYV